MDFRKNFSTLIASVTLMGFISACSQGGFETPAFDSSASQGTGGNDNGSSGGTPNVPQQPSAYDKLDMKGTVDGGAYGGAWAFDLDKANNAILVNLPVPSSPALNINVNIPELPGAALKTYTDSEGKTNVVVSIPLKYIVKGVNFLPAARLPNGQALPKMPSAEAASLGVGLGTNQNVFLYVGVNAVGLYIESSYIPEYLGFTLPIKNQAKTRILGYFTLVPKVGNSKGGLFVALPIPNDIAKILDDHMSGILH